MALVSMENTVLDGIVVTFPKLYEIIDPTSLIPKTKWRDIASRLEIPPKEIENIDLDPQMRTLSMKDICIRLFGSWYFDKDEKATVGKLIQVLEKENLKVCANRLRKYFKIEVSKPKETPTVTSAVSVNSNATADVGDSKDDNDDKDQDLRKKQNEFITENLPDLVDNTTLNTGTLSILVSKGILTKDDSSDLDEITNERKKNKHFYEKILPKKMGYFPILCNAMKETKQSGVLAILNRFKE